MANRKYTYNVTGGRSVAGLIGKIETYLSDKENMQTQRVPCDNPDYTVLQARVKNGKVRKFIGMDKALTIRFIASANSKVIIEFGEAKWVDKGTVMLISMFVLWPLTITSGIGMYKQGRLPGKIRELTDDYLGAENCIQLPEQEERLKSLEEKIDDFGRSNVAQRLVVESQKIIGKIIR